MNAHSLRWCEITKVLHYIQHLLLYKLNYGQEEKFSYTFVVYIKV
jgi:hypothetical protein